MNLLFKAFIFANILNFLFKEGYSQDNKSYNLTIYPEIIQSIGKQTPFWLVSNQFGNSSSKKFNSLFRAKFIKSPNTSKKFNFEYGIDLINRYDSSNKLILNQLYGSLNYRFIILQAGKKEEEFGNQDKELSSGGLLWSKNASPMPKIQIYIPDYTPVPFTKKYLKFKGGIAHGWFDNNELIRNFWLHHKYIYFQAGGNLPIHISYGFNHFAQWGGKTSDPSIGNLPSSFKDFIKVFFVKGGSGSTTTPVGEAENKIGNHLGSENLSLDIQLNKISISTYWQSIIEDNSGFRHKNLQDGLWGLNFTFNNSKIVNHILFEFLNTTNQSKSTFGEKENFDTTILIGPDNYFNHGYYVKGWTYKDMTIGNPFITSPAIEHGTLNFGTSQYIINNRVRVFHFGLAGIIQKISYKFLYSYSLNYGTYWVPFKTIRKQNSILFKIQYPEISRYKLNFEINAGLDLGNMYGNNFGLQINISKNIF